ncbi:MAG: ferrous iron transport protein B [Bacteroidales bacterium]|jgi:ferrous iron transport protein B|nr:ferrous iron transport protein B [Bacteroidales bacterium]
MFGQPIDPIKSSRIDAVLTHKIWGLPIFLGVLWVMFQTTFVLGQIPMNWIEEGVHALNHWLKNSMNESWFKSLLTDGIITGVGGVLMFLPNILILFAFIGLMQDTGYMARVAVIMDKLMHLIGLHGKSFIPLIMGFGCNVPAIMATKVIENRRDRLLTMLIIPFMSCSARLPVYVLIAGAFFPNNAGSVIFLIYVFGILVSMLTAIVLSKTVFKNQVDDSPIVLTPYRYPSLRVMWQIIRLNTGEYLKKISGVVLIASIIVWGLGYFPHHSDLSPREQLEESYLGKIGKTIEPVIEPIGFDWRMGVAAVAGISAKELIVSTMSILYFGEETETEVDEQAFKERFINDEHLQPLNALAFLIFVLLYFPCIAVFITIKNQSGKWRYAVFLALYTTTLAWLAAFAVFQIGKNFF